MLIVWGKKIRRKKLGWQVRFCPLCRDLACCDLWSVNQVGHIYFIPLGAGTRLHDEGTCPSCHSVFAGDFQHLTVLQAAVDDPGTALASLQQAEMDWLTRRLQTEKDISDGTLSPELRAALVIEPIDALNYEFVKFAVAGPYRSVTSLIQFLMLASYIACALFWYFYATDRKPVDLAWAAGLSAVSLAFTAWVFHRTFVGPRRLVRALYVPRLARSLQVLRPTLQEVENAIAQARRVAGKNTLVVWLRASDLVA